MTHLKTAFAAAAIIGVATIGSASAMPATPAVQFTPAAHAAAPANPAVQKVRWVCGPYRCWWRPGPRWWGPRWRWGWHRRYWHRRWRW